MEHYREYLSTGIFALFAYLVIMNPHAPLIVGAMIGLMTGSVGGYYYAMSKKDGTQAVRVENDATNPVPVEAA